MHGYVPALLYANRPSKLTKGVASEQKEGAKECNQARLHAFVLVTSDVVKVKLF